MALQAVALAEVRFAGRSLSPSACLRRPKSGGLFTGSLVRWFIGSSVLAPSGSPGRGPGGIASFYITHVPGPFLSCRSLKAKAEFRGLLIGSIALKNPCRGLGCIASFRAIANLPMGTYAPALLSDALSELIRMGILTQGPPCAVTSQGFAPSISGGISQLQLRAYIV